MTVSLSLVFRPVFQPRTYNCRRTLKGQHLDQIQEEHSREGEVSTGVELGLFIVVVIHQVTRGADNILDVFLILVFRDVFLLDEGMCLHGLGICDF